MQCEYILKNKARCRAKSVTGSKFCFRHDPTLTHKALQASKKGGMKRNDYLSYDETITLKTTADIQVLLGKVINGIWQGKIPTKVGSSIGFLTRCWLDAYEKAELERRVADLEKRVANM